MPHRLSHRLHPRLSADFSCRIRIYWEDTDAGGVVFYANYLKFFERARTEWLRSAGFSQEALRHDSQRMFVVSSTEVRYLAPARLDDEVDVSVRVVEMGRASFLIDQQARRGETVLAEGRIRVGCVDALSFRPARMPRALIDALPLLPDPHVPQSAP
ncbi:MAG: tol-pal system-associated acyl-CoA thioesterase [Leptothrix ochracea]|uniref:tol-pal system-associated acyl-CoA thioesterase n=1 Tax=Leptothrix ochracea TaxID=735331 RepID=UPI0034E2600D